MGDTASTITQHVSKHPATIESLVNEFKKHADTKTIVKIEKNRLIIESTLASFGGDRTFQNLLTETLNKISGATLIGSKSVTVDFAPLATLLRRHHICFGALCRTGDRA